MCLVLSAFEDRVLAFVVKWCCSATKTDLDRLADRLRESCSRPQCAKLASAFYGMAERVNT
jgi:hypothetical protein